MSTSILNTTKKVLGISEDDTSFDVDVVMHINTAFSVLTQLGIGPTSGFMIEDAAPTWEDFLHQDDRFNAVKTYVYLRVRLLFDPPTTSYHVTALNEQIRELEWRLNLTRENDIAPASAELQATVNLDGTITIHTTG